MRVVAFDDATQTPRGAAEARLHRAPRLIDHLRHLCLAELEEVTQVEDETVVVAQATPPDFRIYRFSIV